MPAYRIVIAPDKFKGGASARGAASAIARGLTNALGDTAELRLVPMADGGEGTIDVFLDAGARAETRTVCGPLGSRLRATFAIAGDFAVIEMATASGLALVSPHERDVRRASSFGTGELVRAALDAGVGRIIIGIGGSATNDGGAGMLAALGAVFSDARGFELAPGGVALRDLASIDLTGVDPRLAHVSLDVATDVDSVLCGTHGASVVYGPQKGATVADVRELDDALAHFAGVTARTIGRDVRDRPGAGAAGGLGFAFAAFLGATLRSGAELVAEHRGLEAELEDATLCITGEGRLDQQTLRGKVVACVARMAQARPTPLPVVAFAGSIEGGAGPALRLAGIDARRVSEEPRLLEDAVAATTLDLETAAVRLGRQLRDERIVRIVR